MRAIGVDACPGGWVAVELADGEFAAAQFSPRLADLLPASPASPSAPASPVSPAGPVRHAGPDDAVGPAGPARPVGPARPGARASVIGVDMPLGLLARGWRRADDEAAARLGAQRSRVFRVPPRPALLAPAHAAAVTVCRQLTDPPAGFSIQAWGLREKILEADLLRASRPGHLHEVHPELSFAQLAGGRPVAASKKSWAGQMTRRTLLAAAGIRLPDDLPAAATVPPDDILDAAAVAWTAARIATSQATALPATPQPDDRGHPITIWY